MSSHCHGTQTLVANEPRSTNGVVSNVADINLSTCGLELYTTTTYD